MCCNAPRQLMFGYLKRVYISQLQHLQVICVKNVAKDAHWPVQDTLTAAKDAHLTSLISLDGDEILKEVAFKVSQSFGLKQAHIEGVVTGKLVRTVVCRFQLLTLTNK